MRTPGASVCPSPSRVLVGVYHPDRLRVIDPCRHVTGIVISTRGEADGDFHFDVRLDPAYRSMLTAGNYSEQDAALVVELMPRDHGHLPTVAVGERVSIMGAYVDDSEHGWSEIHPVWALSINGGGVYRSGPGAGGSPAWAMSYDAAGACRTSGGASCVSYSGASSSSSAAGSATSAPSSSVSRSSSSATSSAGEAIVHPGAFCAPEGAHGYTDRGTPMTCKPSSTDSRDRWRHS